MSNSSSLGAFCSGPLLAVLRWLGHFWRVPVGQPLVPLTRCLTQLSTSAAFLRRCSTSTTSCLTNVSILCPKKHRHPQTGRRLHALLRGDRDYDGVQILLPGKAKCSWASLNLLEIFFFSSNGADLHNHSEPQVPFIIMRHFPSHSPPVP